MQTTLTAAPYRPSSPLTGSDMAIYRAENLMLRGQLGNMFYAAYHGTQNLNENIPSVSLTGTVSFSPANRTCTGTGTKFQDELHIGQMFVASNGEPLVVNTIQSQSLLTLDRVPTSTGSHLTAKCPPIILALDTKRATLTSGSVAVTDRGNILAVGSGTLRVNGSVLPGDSLDASRRARIALYNAVSNTYDVYLLGFDEVPDVINTDISVIPSGGTKNMSVGYYSFRVAYYSDTTDGYGNPTAVLLEGGLDGYHVTVANSTLNFDFSNDAGNRPEKSTGYIIYGTLYGNAENQSKVNAIQGPWYEIRRVPYSELTAESIVFDYVDADVSATAVSFDNDTPPDADLLSLFTGYVNLISTNGPGINSPGRQTTTSPGPFVSPMKEDNIDAYPDSYKIPTEKGETIIGFVTAAGRMFVMTPNTLQASTPTGLPTSPFTLRPFWMRGFANPFNLAFIDDVLYGFTTKGAYRSIATGDGADASNDFASGVDAQMASWTPGYVFVVYDPKNSAVCYIHSACSQNEEGWWESEIYVYSLKINDWMPRILLTNDSRDMIVTGAATVHNDLCLIAGGRRVGTTPRYDTWIFDAPNGDGVPYYSAWTYQDSGAEFIGKFIHKLRVKAKTTLAQLQIYTVTPDSDIDVAALEAGSDPVFQAYLSDSDVVKQHPVIKSRIKNALMWTARISGTSISDGTVESLDQIHEIAVDLSVAGQER